MAELRGLLIAIEGGDGTGKATQAELTRQYIDEELRRPVFKTSFPRYGQQSAMFVERYLNGKYGGVGDLPPEVGAILFATDRMAGTPEIHAWLEANPDGIAVLDRYMGSNLAHQGAKILKPEERRTFYQEIMSYEKEVLGILVPDKNIVLTLPATVAQANVDTKDARSYTAKKRDIHEADTDYLERVKECYLELCELFPETYYAIDCLDEQGHMRTREDIQQSIRKTIGLSTS